MEPILEKNKINNGFKRAVYIIILLVLGFTIYMLLNNNDNNSNNNEEKVNLNARQKDILLEEGLSTDYDELTYRQQKGIIAIEEMLCFVEKKYGISFEYAYYFDSTETLIAYPTSGNSEDDSFTVMRELKNGEYVYSDDYTHRVVDPVFNEFVLNYCAEQLGEGNAKVYSICTNIKTDKWPISLEDLPHNVDGFSTIFVNGEIISEEKYDTFIAELKSWLIYNEISGSTQVILFNGGEFKNLTEDNYTDYLQKQYYTRREHINL